MRKWRLAGVLALGVAVRQVSRQWRRTIGQDDLFGGKPSERPGTALITGGSSGIGAAFARQLGRRGDHLLLIARQEERLRELARELGQEGARVDWLAADLTQAEGVRRTAEAARDVADLEVLINNAGFGVQGLLASAAEGGQVEMIELHDVAALRLARAALPGMLARGRGAIINVASVAAFVPLPGSAVYSASKAFLVMLSEALELEVRGSGVRVQALCPGFTATHFHGTPRAGPDARRRLPGFAWLTAEQVARESLAALAGNEVVCVPSRRYRLVVAMARNSVTSWPLRLVAAQLRGRVSEV